jgi:hypothetical protein
MREHIPKTQARDIAGQAQCNHRPALVVNESRLEFWLLHLRGLYDDEVQLTIDGSLALNLPQPNDRLVLD